MIFNSHDKTLKTSPLMLVYLLLLVDRNTYTGFGSFIQLAMKYSILIKFGAMTTTLENTPAKTEMPIKIPLFPTQNEKVVCQLLLE